MPTPGLVLCVPGALPATEPPTLEPAPTPPAPAAAAPVAAAGFVNADPVLNPVAGLAPVPDRLLLG